MPNAAKSTRTYNKRVIDPDAPPVELRKSVRTKRDVNYKEREEDDVNNAPESPVASGSLAASPVLALTADERKAAEAFLAPDV